MMLLKVKEAVGQYLSSIKTLAVALSGGADSVALLSVMLKLSNEYDFSVFAAHYNHKLRGSESDRDMLFVQRFCDELGVKLICGEGDVADFAKKNKLGTELAARQMRYDFFDSIDVDYVATAHTASDNLETVIFNLARGSGIGGLCGIPIKRDKYIRPLIFCTREDIEDYCKKNNLAFVTDSTNLSDDYSRNRIRHYVVPVLKEINPSIEKNVINTSLNLVFDRDMLDSIANSEYQKLIRNDGLDVSNLASLHPSISGRVLRMFCIEKTGITPDYRHSDDLLNVAINGGRCSLCGHAQAYRQKNILKIELTNDKTDYKVNIVKQKKDFTQKGKKINNLLLKNLLDCDKIVGNLKVRTREDGDKIHLLGRGCTKTLKQLYNEYSIPLGVRKYLPVIADDAGPIWICGFGVARRVAPDNATKFVYKISYETISKGK